MNILLKSTYTFETLKQNILKILGEYSLNGNINSSASGFLADVEKKLVSTLNICLRRVILSMPLLEKTADLQFFGGKSELPAGCYEVKALYSGDCGSMLSFDISDNKIVCKSIAEGANGQVVYSLSPRSFTYDMPSDTLVELPDITSDALCYLTASELVPAENGELYSKLMYRYRDIIHNCYDCEGNYGGRNSFFKADIRRFR